MPGPTKYIMSLTNYSWCVPALQAPFTEREDAIIRLAHLKYGGKWALISRLLPGRTDNSIKNHFNCTLVRKEKLGIFRNRYLAAGDLNLEELLNLPEPRPVVNANEPAVRDVCNEEDDASLISSQHPMRYCPPPVSKTDVSDSPSEISSASFSPSSTGSRNAPTKTGGTTTLRRGKSARSAAAGRSIVRGLRAKRVVRRTLFPTKRTKIHTSAVSDSSEQHNLRTMLGGIDGEEVNNKLLYVPEVPSEQPNSSSSSSSRSISSAIAQSDLFLFQTPVHVLQDRWTWPDLVEDASGIETQRALDEKMAVEGLPSYFGEELPIPIDAMDFILGSNEPYYSQLPDLL